MRRLATLMNALAAVVLAGLPIILILQGGETSRRRWSGEGVMPPQPCEWVAHETPNVLDLRVRIDRDHLTADALAAENTAVRHADLTRGPRSGAFEGFDVYGAAREACMADLFRVIAAHHGVSPENVRHSRTHRPLGPDVAVFLAFGVIYTGMAYWIAGWFRRRFPMTQSGSAVLAIGVLAVLTAIAGVMLGEFWAGQVEAARIGTTHMSYRGARIPWVRHRTEVFAVGLMIFWLIALLRYRIKPKNDDGRLYFSLL